MTPAERAKIAVDGMRLKNDERGRGPSHDEVEELLTRVIEEVQSPAPPEYHVGDRVTLSDGTQGVITLVTKRE
jgi:hypothetical protein